MKILDWLGGLINAIGVLGLGRDGEYRSSVPSCQVRVRCARAFTIVTVNGVDAYFRRFSGRVDGCATRLTHGVAPAHD
jgi:hypothetical protein